MKSDLNWIKDWSKFLEGKDILELGCGEGTDTRLLKNYSENLISCDINPRAQNCRIVKLDHSKKLPFRNSTFDVVLASLCLHYFNLNTTISIVNEISNVLRHDGLLICRLNSVNDHNYGATGYPEIESRYFKVGSNLKRFFNSGDVESLFKGKWQLFDLKEKTIDRYEKSKVVWEFGAAMKYVADT